MRHLEDYVVLYIISHTVPIFKKIKPTKLVLKGCFFALLFDTIDI